MESKDFTEKARKFVNESNASEQSKEAANLVFDAFDHAASAMTAGACTAQGNTTTSGGGNGLYSGDSQSGGIQSEGNNGQESGPAA